MAEPKIEFSVTYDGVLLTQHNCSETPEGERLCAALVVMASAMSDYETAIGDPSKRGHITLDELAFLRKNIQELGFEMLFASRRWREPIGRVPAPPK